MEKPQESTEAAEAPNEPEGAPNPMTKTLKVIGFTLLGAAVAIPAICLYLGKRWLKGEDGDVAQDQRSEPEREAPHPIHIPVSSAPASATAEETISECAPEERARPTWVASTESDKFHVPGCRWAQRIREEHRLTFEDRQEAIARGYVPCGTCTP